MDDLLGRASQIAISLMFHILFAIAGMAMPVLIVVSESLWRRELELPWLAAQQ